MSTFNATVKVDSGHCILYLIEADNNTTLRTIQDNGTAQCALVPGVKYEVQWHFCSDQTATYTLDLESDIGAPHFPFTNTYNYSGAHNDMGGFYFTA